ncbi:hypothetical protein ACFYS8_13310 [Kitasatospora sp. NPDC004615]|uniref:hypothetical protein n=1 Tax=unclassified Kitasatospora TaxID=2633591 RepID=UPI0036CD6783
MTAPTPPAEWTTTTEWPIRLKLGSHPVHAAANVWRSWYECWTACGKRPGEYQTPMPSGWSVTCRGCRTALATQAEATGASR